MPCCTTPSWFSCGEVSEWFKEHAWKVCIRLNPVSRVRIPPSPPLQQPRERLWWPRWRLRDDRSKTPPGPEGSNGIDRSEEHTSELQSLMRNSYAVFCLKKKKKYKK